MVNHEPQLDRIFGALVNPTRRAILMQLEAGGGDGASVSALAEPLAMKLPAMLKHLDVLEGAELITREKTGRTMLVYLAPAPMAQAAAWLQRYQRFWSHSLDRLAAHAQAEEARKKKSEPSRGKRRP